MNILILLVATATLLVQSATATSSASIVVSPSRPTGAITVPHDFPGFGFESCSLDAFDNDISRNLLSSLGKRMPVKPIVRIGGTSGDKFKYNAVQAKATICESGDCSPGGYNAVFSLGPSYFKAFAAFPMARLTVQAPLEKVSGTEEPQKGIALDYINLALKELGGGVKTDRVEAIAIGNEPNFYDPNATNYADQAQTLEKEIVANLSLSGDQSRIFEVANAASGTHPSWFKTAFDTGLNANGLAKQAACHYYHHPSGPVGTASLQRDLLNHSSIVAQMAPHRDNIAFLKSKNPNVPYLLSETGPALSGANVTSYLNAFAFTLFYIDFMLYGMSVGVARVDGTQRPANNHSYWVPASGDLTGNRGNEVRAGYYAWPFVADFLGNTSSSVGVVELNVGEEKDHQSAYAVYEDNKLARVALLNMKVWMAVKDGVRGNATFEIDGVDATDAKIARLTAKEGASARGYDVDRTNITWAGEQWAYKIDEGNGHVVGEGWKQLDATGAGKISVDVSDSEAVMLDFTGKVGASVQRREMRWTA